MVSCGGKRVWEEDELLVTGSPNQKVDFRRYQTSKREGVEEKQ